jgi:hypothetical protein
MYVRMCYIPEAGNSHEPKQFCNISTPTEGYKILLYDNDKFVKFPPATSKFFKSARIKCYSLTNSLDMGVWYIYIWSNSWQIDDPLLE